MSKKIYNVLVVDDEQKICDLILIFLKTSPYIKMITTANSAIQAAQKMSNQEFDLVITDYVIPGKNGIEFVANIKKSVHMQNARYLLISGFLKEQDVFLAVESGIKQILVKPFTRKQLLNKVYEILEIDDEN